jgi:hypothetical protein
MSRTKDIYVLACTVKFSPWQEDNMKQAPKTTNTNREHLLSCSISYVIVLFFKLLILVSIQTFIRSKLFRWDMARWKNDFEHDLKNLIRLLTGFSVTISQYISDKNTGTTTQLCQGGFKLAVYSSIHL